MTGARFHLKWPLTKSVSCFPYALNTAERYATTMGLSQVDDNNLEKVRGFVTGLGAEFGAIFDALWTHGDESKLERLAEVKLAEMSEGGIRR